MTEDPERGPDGASSSPEWVGVRHAAERLGVSQTTVKSMVGRGELLAWRTPGGHRRILKASLQAIEHAYRNAHHRSPRRLQPALEASETSSNPALRVVMLSVDPEVRRLLERGVTPHLPRPVQIRATDSLPEAMLWVGRLLPQLVCLDADLPGVDLPILLRTLETGSPRPPLVLVHAAQPPTGLPPGVVGLAKPLNLAVLRGCLLTLLALLALLEQERADA